MNNFKIGNFMVGGDKTFIIAELSANHNGSIDVAKKTIHAAKKAGADCIKLQTYTADTITLNCQKEDFLIKGTLWEGKRLYELYKEAYTPWEWHQELIKEANSLGLECFSSPFDFSAVDFLETLDVPAYKIASFEITDIPLIRYVAKQGKPIIISTGIASKDDISLAIKTCREEGNNQIALLKCTSSYPAPIEDANLNTMTSFKTDFNTIIGLSDHTLGNVVPISSVAMGGKIIEKHFILDRGLGGPDADFSLNPEEFRDMVNQVRLTEKAVGQFDYPVTEKMKAGKQFARSLYFSKDLKAGKMITSDDVRSVRPGYGLHPKYIDQVIGKKLTVEVEIGDRVSFKDIE
jgi:pseudaminic acid synthase